MAQMTFPEFPKFPKPSFPEKIPETRGTYGSRETGTGAGT